MSEKYKSSRHIIFSDNNQDFSQKFIKLNNSHNEIYQLTYMCIENNKLEFVVFLMNYLKDPEQNENQLIELAFFKEYYDIVDFLVTIKTILKTLKETEPEIFNYYISKKINKF